MSVRGVSRFFRECSDVYMENFWSEPTIHLPQDASSLERAIEMCQYLMRQEGVRGRDDNGGGVGQWCLRGGCELDGS